MSGPKGVDFFIGDGTPALAGDAFVVIKASEGAGYPPPGAPELAWYPQEQARIRATGALFGAFHYWHPSTPNAAQLANFKARANLAPGDLIQLDAETTDGLSWPVVNARKNDMLARLKAEFPYCRVLLYTFLDYWNHIDGNTADGLWIADPSAPAGAPRVAHWVIHQYGSGGVDYDIANFPDAAAMRAWATGLIPTKDPEVLPMQFIANAGPDMGDWFWDNGKYVGIAAPSDLQALQSLNIPTISISVPMHQRLVAAAAPAPTATVTIDPAGFVAALTQAAPAAATAIAHALAVQEHNDTPGS